jgi:threonine dehydratase
MTECLTAGALCAETEVMSALNANLVAVAAREAAIRIDGLVRKTPLDRSPRFSAATDADVWFKLENLQFTGSFKLRGATNLLLSLTAEERAQGCVAASSGNHGAGVAYAAQRLGNPAIVFVPDFTTEAKIEAIRSYGGDVRIFGSDGLDTETHARAFAASNGMEYVSPYNDPRIIAGQGTCGVEIVDELSDVDVLYIAVGGGGLVSGVASVVRERNPSVRVVGCQPRGSAVMAHSVAAGRILDEASSPTLSDGTAGGVEPDSITFELCRELIDEFVLIDEEQIAAAMRRFIDFEHHLIEGSAGVAVAAMLSEQEQNCGRTVVVLICGGNVSRNTLRQVLREPAST